MYVNLKNPSTGEVKQCKVGFSWTVFFWGFWPAVFRGDWKWAIFLLLLAICSLSISDIVFAFLYNKIYIKDLLEKDYQPMSASDRQILRQKGLYFK